jgi:hypothetical protein
VLQFCMQVPCPELVFQTLRVFEWSVSRNITQPSLVPVVKQDAVVPGTDAMNPVQPRPHPNHSGLAIG